MVLEGSVYPVRLSTTLLNPHSLTVIHCSLSQIAGSSLPILPYKTRIVAFILIILQFFMTCTYIFMIITISYYNGSSITKIINNTTTNTIHEISYDTAPLPRKEWIEVAKDVIDD